MKQSWRWTRSRPIMFVGSMIMFFVIADTWSTQSSGWTDLSKRYSYNGPPPSTTVRQHVSFSAGNRGPINCERLLSAGATTKGLYLSAPWFLRFRKHALLIPWQSVGYFSRTYWSCSRFDTEIHLKDIPIAVDLTDDGSSVYQILVMNGIPERSRPGVGCP